MHFRSCWGCWRAPRSSSPHGAAAVASTLRSPTTSCPWPAARSGQTPLQQTKKTTHSYQNHWTWFCLLQVWSVAPQYVKCAQTQIVFQSVLTSAGEYHHWCPMFFHLHADKTPHLPFHCLFNFTLIMSVAFSAVLSLTTPGKFICVFMSAVCVSVCWSVTVLTVIDENCSVKWIESKKKNIDLMCFH